MSAQEKAISRHKALIQTLEAPLRHPHMPFRISMGTFIAKDLQYPRAAVRLDLDGKWLVQIWFTPMVVEVDLVNDRYTSHQAAIKAGQQKVHAARARRHPAGQVHLMGAVKEIGQ